MARQDCGVARKAPFGDALPMLRTGLLIVSLFTATGAIAAVDCAQCKAACSIRSYPNDDHPNLRSNAGLQHVSADAEAAFNEGTTWDPGLGGIDAKRAVAGYKRAVLLDAENATYRNHLAAALLGTGKGPEAVYNLERAVALAPGEAKYRVNLGYAFHRAGDETRALVWYLRALALDPLDARARLFTGYALENLSLPAEAIAEYRLVLVQEPSNTGAREGLVRLRAAARAEPPGPFDPADARR